MNYFIDTEFIEGTQKTLFKSKPTIDLISIGIVCEDGREYYAISKDFNLKEAWNRFQIDKDDKIYWIRENVCKNLFNNKIYNNFTGIKTFKEFKHLVEHFGKTNKQIAEEIKDFCKPCEGDPVLMITDGYEKINIGKPNDYIYSKSETWFMGKRDNPKFYGFYSDYDWVVFCWLFEHMIDLPQGFPYLCIELEQRLRDICERKASGDETIANNIYKAVKEFPNYPKQDNEHNALSDARFNHELYKFLKTL